MGAASEIVEWSEGRSLWQRDALRRLATKSELSPNDLDELVLIAKEQYGVIDPSAPAPSPIPLSSVDLPDRATAEAVSLLVLSDVHCVNALAAKQSLVFEPQGLTVIYGDNATGKSGYIRILKRLCRARAAESPILGNVFEPEKPGVDCASVKYAVGATSFDLGWRDDGVCPNELSAVSVFDTPSAEVYVEAPNVVAYVPFGLDMLRKLAAACGQIAGKLEQERKEDRSKLDNIPPNLAGTASGRWFVSITHKTKIDDIERHATYSAQDAEERERLGQVLAQKGPKGAAAESDAKRGRYILLRDRLRQIAETATSGRVDEFEQARRQLREAEDAVALANAQQFQDVPIPCVGSNAWLRMWEAAEQFKREIHERHANRSADVMERCPLCQQYLDSDAQARFRAFAEYFLARERSDAAAKRTIVEGYAAQFEALPLDAALHSEVLKELGIAHPEVAQSISAYVESCRAILAFIEAIESGIELPPRPTMTVLDTQPLSHIIEQLGLQVQELLSVSRPEESAKLVERANELNAKAWLAERREQLIAEVQRLDRHHRLKQAEDDSATIGITKKATQLTRRYVTSALRKSFSTELSGITALPPRVRLTGLEGRKGLSYYRLEIEGCTEEGISTNRVLSEGELRAISLAAFLAELSTQETKSAVVFDDPISSLDIHNRELLADRLVKLASERQVIVFTHDAFFLATLLDDAKKAKTRSSTCMVERMLNAAGVVVSDTPWEAKKLAGQVRALQERCQTAREEAEQQHVANFDAHRDKICTDMRKAIERAVEEVLLDGIVMRYQRQVRVANVKKLSAISNDDLALIDGLMTKYSTYEHSQSAVSRAPPPDIGKLEEDINALSEWRSRFENKKRDL